MGIEQYLVPDTITKVPFKNGPEADPMMLKFSIAHDSVHWFPYVGENGQHIVKYWNTDIQPPQFCDILVPADVAVKLVEQVGLPLVDRKQITNTEYNHCLGWLANQVVSLEAELGLDDIEMPEGFGDSVDES